MIGIFDSGYGGLSIFREVVRILPEYDFIYFGDNARAPYGDRSHAVIYQNTKEACDWLFSQGCQLVILACNTASAQALRQLQQEYLPVAYLGRRILGVLVPIAEVVGRRVAKGDRVGVIATRATVDSGAYIRELQKYIPAGVEIIQQACPLLAPLVEEGWIDHPITRGVVREYLAPLREKQLHTLILGCTHYQFLQSIIQDEIGRQCFIPNPGVIVAASLRDYLIKHPEIGQRVTKNSLRRYVTTDRPERFLRFAAITDIQIGNPEHVPVA